MIRSECTSETLIIKYLDQCIEVCAWENALRLKWLINSSLSTQITEDEITETATEHKFKTL